MAKKRTWFVVVKGLETCVRVTPDRSGPAVALVMDARGTEDIGEVAAILAAAPDLLEASEAALASLMDPELGQRETLKSLRDAIAKAKAKEPLAQRPKESRQD